MKEKIIGIGTEKFFKEGFHKTTMDEIAADLRMSKKTIYKHFPTKEDLVQAVAKNFMQIIKGTIIPILSSDKNAIEKLEGLMNVLATTFQKISSKMMDDLRRHYPSRWDEIDKFRTEMMFGNLTKVIEQGKKEGLFLDYPTEIVITIFVSAMRSVVNPDFILNNNFSLKEAAITSLKIMISGIVTEKGKKLLVKNKRD
jgi:AcrR family transcriptional regulator